MALVDVDGLEAQQKPLPIGVGHLEGDAAIAVELGTALEHGPVHGDGLLPQGVIGTGRGLV